MTGERSVRGQRRYFPSAVLDDVLRWATELHRSVAGDDLFLLALAGLDGDPPARRALEAEDVTAGRILEAIRTSGDDHADPPRWLHYSPAYYTIHGLAQGMAATLGEGTITPEHVLLALLWEPQSHSSQLLWRLGVSRERVVDRLAQLGVAVPRNPLPPQEEVEWGDAVWFDRAQTSRVLDHVRLHVPPHIDWGFNYEGDRAWVHAEASVDLESLVAEALARSAPGE